MKRSRILAGALRLDSRGATIVEFAFVAPVLILAIIGGLDLGYQAYLQAMLQGALNDVSRTGSLERVNLECSGDDTEEKIECAIKRRTNIVARNANYEFDIQSYRDFSEYGQGEKLVTDYNSNGQYDTGDCFQDLNENGSFDVVAGRDGVGGADDVVFYRVTVKMPRLLPMDSLLNWSPEYTIGATTAIRNQPYARQKVPPTVCV